MKVCHVCSYFNNVLFSKLVESQEGLGARGRVFYFRAKGKDAPHAEKPYVDFSASYYPWERAIFHWKHRNVLRDFKKKYAKKSFDLLFAHSLFSNGYIAYRINQQWEIPYIVMVQNTDLNVFFKRVFWLRGMGRRILANASYIITASETYKEELTRKYIPESMREQIQRKIEVIPYGIDDWFFQESPGAEKRKEEALTVLTVGTVCRNKNQATVCKALEKMWQQGFHVRYIVIGASWDDHVLKKIKSYHFVEYIPFMAQEQLIEHYRKADLFVLLSNTETFGLVYAEALSQGLPIVYTKGQGFDRQFEEGAVGYHVEAGDVEGLIETIKQICKNRASFQGRCQEAAKKFLWASIAEQYVSLYKRILK